MEATAAATSSQPIQSATTQPPPQGEIRVAAYRTTPTPQSGESYVFPPSNVPASGETVTIYVASGGQGGGHLSPMDAVAAKLQQLPGVRVIYDAQLPVHTFARGKVDHWRYKASNTKFGAFIANNWRKVFAASDKFGTIVNRVQQLTANETIHYAFTNHRFIGHALDVGLPTEVPLGIDIVDPGKPHQGWYHSRITAVHNALDRLFATNPAGVAHARKHGVPHANIQELGYPVRAAFERYANVPKEDVRAQLGIQEGKRVVMMTAGNARNPGAFVDQVRGLLAHERAGELHIIALTARNTALANELNGLEKNGAHIEALGMQTGEQMAQLMRAADFMAIQPGGGSIGECYAMGVVPIIWGEKSGIEHANRKHVQRNETGIVAFNPSGSKSQVDDATLFRNAVFDTPPAQIEQMRANQQKFRVLGAAEAIARSIVQLARQRAGLPALDEAAAAAGVPQPGMTPAAPTTTGSDPTPTTPFSPEPDTIEAMPGSSSAPPQRRDF